MFVLIPSGRMSALILTNKEHVCVELYSSVCVCMYVDAQVCVCVCVYEQAHLCAGVWRPEINGLPMGSQATQGSALALTVTEGLS